MNDKAVLGGSNRNSAFDIRTDCNVTYFSNSTEKKVSELTKSYGHGNFFELVLYTGGKTSNI